MNKVLIFAAFVLTMSSCQKEVIVPQQDTAGMILKDESTSPTSVVTPIVTTTSPTDPIVPTEDPGDITDPMRKKDKKDS